MPFSKVRSWDIALERFKKGIDNAHIDVHLSPHYRQGVRETVQRLILEEAGGSGGQLAREPMRAQDLESFRQAYQSIFATISEKARGRLAADRLALLQVSLLKHLIQAAVQGSQLLREDLAGAEAMRKEASFFARTLRKRQQPHSSVIDEHIAIRRILRFLFRQVRRLENIHLRRMRESLAGVAWPFPKRAFFNPVLMFPELEDIAELIPAYPIANLAEGGDLDWLFQTNQCLSMVFQHYLPSWTRLPSYSAASVGGGPAPKVRERLDQGQLQGFLGTEMLLSRFVPAEEYLEGRCSWLDDPENLRMFLSFADKRAEASRDLHVSPAPDLHEPESAFAPDSTFDHGAPDDESLAESGSHWCQEDWPKFQRAMVDELHRCIDLKGLGQRIMLLYRLPVIRSELGRPIPFSLVEDFVAGRITRRRLSQRLHALKLALDPALVGRVLERVAAESKRIGPEARAKCLNAYLTDFLALRRDLKLAYKTYEAMDRIRLLEEGGDVQLSRANASLYEFASNEGRPLSERRVAGHVVLKADVRGSTRITERLRELGLNPASHFSLNFFDPVNKLLPDFGAEKLFVEGDAVILAVFEHEAEPAAMTVSRACALARSMLQVVSLKNVVNRKHGLPDLELGMGISFSQREPNFLYDEEHRIMISGAINRADRLSSSASELKTSQFRPGDGAFRVEVVRARTARGDVLLSYNVNGIKLEKAAFFKLQRELDLRQVRLPEEAVRDSLFFVGSFPDLAGKEQTLVIRYAPVRGWNGRFFGPVDPDHGQFFEVIADQPLATRVRKLAAGKQGMPLRGRN